MTGDAVPLLTWRRAIGAAYAAARAAADPEEGWQQWRRARDRIFAEHPQSPLEDRSGFTALPFAPYDPALRFVVPVSAADPAPLDVPTSDGVVRFERVGRVDLPVGSLDLWWLQGYGGGLFLPFRDASNGTATYGGGRYLLDTVKGADLGGDADALVVDLNFAYHPSCYYSARWSCPLAPPGNRLEATVSAGELTGEPAGGGPSAVGSAGDGG